MNLILKPLSYIYDFITALRNKKFDEGKSRIVSFSIPIISIGNLSVGGTGKTPFVEYLIQHYQESKNIGILSRGYGRSTKGAIYANEDATAKMIGDEPMQYFSKYNNIEVVVSEQRVLGMPFFCDSNLIILDDAYQHRAIDRNVNIMLSDFNKPFFKDFVLPLGRLRENRVGAKRADIIIFTKVNEELTQEKINYYKSATKYYAPNSKIFFTSISYGNAYLLKDNSTFSFNTKGVFLLTSIANPAPLFHYLTTDLQISINKHYNYRDHYSFTLKTIQRIEKEIGKGEIVVVSEKDAVKLKPFIYNTSLLFVVIPILPKVLIHQEEELFEFIDFSLSNDE